MGDYTSAMADIQIALQLLKLSKPRQEGDYIIGWRRAKLLMARIHSREHQFTLALGTSDFFYLYFLFNMFHVCYCDRTCG